MSNLSNGVGISISFSLTIVSIKMSISSISMAMAIGDTSDNTTVKSMSNLANGVGVTVTVHSGNSQEDKCTSSHVEQSWKTGNDLKKVSLFIVKESHIQWAWK